MRAILGRARASDREENGQASEVRTASPAQRVKILRCALLGIKWTGPDLAPPGDVQVDKQNADMDAVISKMGLARRLDIDPRTLDGALNKCGILPDFVNGARKLFYSHRVKTLRGQIGEARR